MKKIDGRKYRHELKFNIGLDEYHVLKQRLASILELDPHAGPDGRYNIRSLYFDDFRNSALFEKQAGVARRKKYRMRIYNYSDEFIKFERKTKLDHYVMKDWTRLTREEADKMIAGDVEFLADSEDRLLKAFYLECRRNLLRPVVLVDYHREAYVHPVGNVRITFDMGLHTSLGAVALFDRDSPTMGVDEEYNIILEIKFDDALPQHILGLFPSTIRPRSAIGKYAICRESTNALTGCSVTRF